MEDLVRSCLAQRFAPYRSTDRVCVEPERSIIRVEYGSPKNDFDLTRFVAYFKPRSCYLFALSVEPALRGQGHGRALFSVVEQLASTVDSPLIRLTSFEESEGFWTRLGFQYCRDNTMMRWMMPCDDQKQYRVMADSA